MRNSGSWSPQLFKLPKLRNTARDNESQPFQLCRPVTAVAAAGEGEGVVLLVRLPLAQVGLCMPSAACKAWFPMGRRLIPDRRLWVGDPWLERYVTYIGCYSALFWLLALHILEMFQKCKSQHRLQLISKLLWSLLKVRYMCSLPAEQTNCQHDCGIWGEPAGSVNKTYCISIKRLLCFMGSDSFQSWILTTIKSILLTLIRYLMYALVCSN